MIYKGPSDKVPVIVLEGTAGPGTLFVDDGHGERSIQIPKQDPDTPRHIKVPWCKLGDKVVLRYVPGA